MVLLNEAGNDSKLFCLVPYLSVSCCVSGCVVDAFVTGMYYSRAQR